MAPSEDSFFYNTYTNRLKNTALVSRNTMISNSHHEDYERTYDIQQFQYVPVNKAFFNSKHLLFLSQNNGLLHQNKRSVFPDLDQTVVLGEEKQYLVYWDVLEFVIPPEK